MALSEETIQQLQNLRAMAAQAQTEEEAQFLLQRIQDMTTRVQAESRGYAPVPGPLVSSQEGDFSVPVGSPQAQAMIEQETTPSVGEQRLASIVQGLTLGGGDEMLNLIGMDESGQRLRQASQASMERAPLESMGLGMAGGLGIGMASAPLLAGARSLPGLVGRSSALGATEGALAGALSADEGSRALGAGIGAGIGGPLGAVMPLVPNFLSRTLTNRGATDTATQRLGSALRQDDILPQQLLDLPPTGAPENIPELAARALDTEAMGTTTGGMARSLVTRPGPGRAVASANIRQRERGLYDRVSQNIAEAFGGPEYQMNRQIANDLYTNYRSQPFQLSDQSPVMRIVNAFPAEMRQALNRGRRSSLAENVGDVATGAAQRDANAMDWNVLHHAKMGLDSQIGMALARNDRGTARDLLNIKRGFLDALEQENPAYAPARRFYAGEAEMQNAFRQGTEIGGTAPDVVEEFLGTMSEPQRHQFRAGAMQAMQREIDRKVGEAPNYAQAIIRNQDWRNRIRMLAESPEQADAIMNWLRAESAGHETFAQTLRGSRTAPSLAEVDAEGFFSSLVAAMSNPIGGINQAAGRALGALTQGNVGPMESRLAQMLTTSDPDEIRQVLQAVQAGVTMPGSLPTAMGLGAATGAVGPVIDQFQR